MDNAKASHRRNAGGWLIYFADQMSSVSSLSSC